jgi:hypothetical protein
MAVIVNIIKGRKYQYPPGPKPLPLIGNIHQMPQGQLGKWAQGLAKEYGEMFTIKIGETRWVFLTSTRTIKDLLEKRASVCSCWVLLSVDLQLETTYAHVGRYHVQWKTVISSNVKLTVGYY